MGNCFILMFDKSSLGLISFNIFLCHPVRLTPNINDLNSIFFSLHSC